MRFSPIAIGIYRDNIEFFRYGGIYIGDEKFGRYIFAYSRNTSGRFDYEFTFRRPPMSDIENSRSSGPHQVVKRGETYHHSDHGRVEVTGIWKGVNQVDKARNVDETGVIIVRYSTEGMDDTVGVDELTDTVDEFLAAIE